LWRMLRRRPDVVLCIEPTFAVAPVALFGAWLIRARTVLHVQDLEVDAAIAVGHVRLPAMLRRMAFGIESWLLRRFSMVVTISNQMAAELLAKGADGDRVRVIRNWVDSARIRPLDRPSAYRAELGFAEDDFIVLYAGQIGAKQSLHLLFDAAQALVAEPNIRFVVAGEGPLKESFTKRYGHLPNLTLLPLQPEERLCEFLNLADCHLLPQDPAVADLVLPSKLGGMLASGKRIIATADPQSEMAEFLGEAAEIVTPAELGHAIKRAADDRQPFNASPGLGIARSISVASSMAAFEEALFCEEQAWIEHEGDGIINGRA
jgi:colanic acid biosynthesis glycosyl transferase WcaI